MVYKVIICILILPNKMNFSKQILGSSLSLPTHGRAGARATPFLAALFAKQKTKFGGGKARAGKNSWWTSTLQPPSFLPARAKIIKSQRQDFLGKKFGFCSRQTAN